ncbi:MAG: hypothetical protein MUP76_04600 [Acidimicrobiia bacterium]|nr:hypothetical protein [Acidimicrobiia bacterium]
MPSNRDRPLAIPYLQVPHGLWTLDVTPKAALLLGWLHSHGDNYRDRLTLNRIGKEFGGGRKSVTRLCDQLAEAGFISMEIGGEGHPAHVILLSDPWEALVRLTHVSDGRTPLRQIDAPPCVSVTHPPASNGRTIEEQREEQVSTTAEKTTQFAEFWEQYPRKVGKAAALKAWSRMLQEERDRACDTIDLHTQMWAAEGRGLDTIPHASTWLNGERWEDEVAYIAPRTTNTKAARTRAAIQTATAQPKALWS